jgi:hypothetical protein
LRRRKRSKHSLYRRKLRRNNMTSLYKYILASIIFLAVSASIVMWQVTQTDASNFPGTDYKAQEFKATGAATTSLKSLGGTIGSVVVTTLSSTTATSSMIFYDTRLTSTTTHASTTVLFTMPKTTGVAGTYTFDVEFTRGLLVETTAGFNGNYVVTYR